MKMKMDSLRIKETENYFRKLQQRAKKELAKNRRPPKGKKTRLFIDNEYVSRGYLRTLPPYATKVFIVLARYANQKTQSCFPSLKTIQKNAGVTRGSAMNSIKILEGFQIISVLKRSGGAKSNRYLLLDPKTWKPPSKEMIEDFKNVKIRNIIVPLEREKGFL